MLGDALLDFPNELAVLLRYFVRRIRVEDRGASLLRLYRPNNEDGWQRASSFRRDDLPLVAKVTDHCHTWIHEIWQQERLYHVCGKCTAKWFSRAECSECPRCGSTEVSSTTAIPPWAGESPA